MVRPHDAGHHVDELQRQAILAFPRRGLQLGGGAAHGQLGAQVVVHGVLQLGLQRPRIGDETDRLVLRHHIEQQQLGHVVVEPIGMGAKTPL